MTEMTYGLMQGRYPAIVRSYDQARRTCRVEIPGLTDGADTLPEAEIEYPVGDTVWIAFIGGDPRYPSRVVEIEFPEEKGRINSVYHVTTEGSVGYGVGRVFRSC